LIHTGEHRLSGTTLEDAPYVSLKAMERRHGARRGMAELPIRRILVVAHLLEGLHAEVELHANVARA
jgi:hypothetical protein